MRRRSHHAFVPEEDVVLGRNAAAGVVEAVGVDAEDRVRALGGDHHFREHALSAGKLVTERAPVLSEICPRLRP